MISSMASRTRFVRMERFYKLRRSEYVQALPLSITALLTNISELADYILDQKNILRLW